MRVRGLVLGAMLVCSAPIGVRAQSAVGVDRVERVRTEIDAFLTEEVRAFADRDWDALRRMYVDDDRLFWVEDGEVRYRSFDEMLEGLRSFPPGMTIHTEYTDRRVVVIGTDAAHLAAAFRTRVGDGAQEFEFSGRISMLLERWADGWRIVTGHTSTGATGGR